MKKILSIIFKIVVSIYIILSSLIISLLIFFENGTFFSNKKLISHVFSKQLDNFNYVFIFLCMVLIIVTILVLIIKNEKFQLNCEIFLFFIIGGLFFLFIILSFTETWQVYDSHISHFSPLDPKVHLRTGINNWINYIFFILLNCSLLFHIKPYIILKKIMQDPLINKQIKNLQLKFIFLYLLIIILIFIRMITQFIPKPDDIFMFYTG